MSKVRASLKAASFTESVIREMTRLAMAHDAINLSQGYPDFPAPQELKEAARAAIAADINQYPITWGAEAFRQELEEIELLGGQGQLVVPPAGHSRSRFEDQVGDHKPLHRAAGPAKLHAQPRDELLDGKRLYQVVVGSRLQPPDTIRNSVPRGQHDHRHSQLAPAQLTTHLESVQPWQ